LFPENHDRLLRQWKLPESGEIIFLNSKVNAGFKHSKLLENVAPVHHLEIPVAKHINIVLLVKTAIMLVIKQPKQQNQNKVKKKKITLHNKTNQTGCLVSRIS
jgi:hypothetical protein